VHEKLAPFGIELGPPGERHVLHVRRRSYSTATLAAYDGAAHRPVKTQPAHSKAKGITRLTLIGIVGCLSLIGYWVWAEARERDQLARQEQLLFVGGQLRRAIEQYYERSPASVKQLPGSLQDLLTDRRFASVQQHLISIPLDPFTGLPEWGLVRAANGLIMGVHSLSDEEPLISERAAALGSPLAGKSKYSEAIFVFTPTVPVTLAPIREAHPPEPASPVAGAWPAAAAPVEQKTSAPATQSAAPIASLNVAPATQPPEFGEAIPGIPSLLGEVDRLKRICIVNATRFGASCLHDPTTRGSEEALKQCVVDAQSRYAECLG
jgi:hypothetical protein